MNELSNAARAALEAGRHGLAAPAGAREEMQARVFAAAGVAGPAASAPAAASVPLAAKLFVVGALVVGAAGVGWWLLRNDSAPSRPVQAAVTAPPPAPVVAAPPRVTPIVPAAPPAPAPAPAVTPPRARTHHPLPAPSPADGLAGELRLVGAARRALVNGDPRAALAKIVTYQRRFAHGELAPEAALVRIDALCAAGRVADADAEVDRFVNRWPDSPHRRRALRGCPAAGKGTAGKGTDR